MQKKKKKKLEIFINKKSEESLLSKSEKHWFLKVGIFQKPHDNS